MEWGNPALKEGGGGGSAMQFPEELLSPYRPSRRLSTVIPDLSTVIPAAPFTVIPA